MSSKIEWLLNRNLEIFDGLKFDKDVDLSNYCSFKIGGNAPVILMPHSIDQLRKILYLARVQNLDYIILGKGSNILFPDDGLDKLIIRTTELNDISFEENYINASAGLNLSQISIIASKLSLSGLEFAHGIPGTLGGGCYMNAGAYGSEIKDIVTEVKAIDLHTRNLSLVVLKNEDCKFGYRSSIFTSGQYFIISAKLKLEKLDQADIIRKMNEFDIKRKNSQPLEFPSAGSVFKRPEGYYAGTLIDECGLKGYRIGGAEVSKKHAGFIINSNKATEKDVLALIQYIQNEVYKQKGVLLEQEIKEIK